MHSKLVYFFAGALVAVISSAATRALDVRQAISKGTIVNLSPEDYLEIMQLQNYYPRDVDPGAVRNSAWKFTNDARALIQPGRPMTKPEDFEEFFGGFIAPDGQAAKGGGASFQYDAHHRRTPRRHRARIGDDAQRPDPRGGGQAGARRDGRL